MSVNGTDAVFQAIYRPFLNGGRQTVDDTAVQQQIESMLQRTLMELCIARFEWTGLPDEIDVRWMEMSLAANALSVFHYDATFGKYFAMRGAGTGNLNMVGNPTEFIVYGNQFYTKTLPATKCVPIWANNLRVPDIDIIEVYARKIANIDRTVEINARTARRTKVMRYSEKSKLSAENIDRELEKGASLIKVMPEVALQEMYDVVDLGTNPDTIVNLDILRDRQWTKALNLLGINTANQDKKERLVAAEVSGNNDEIASIRAKNLQARQRACDQINKMFFGGKDKVWVEYVTDMETPELTDQNATPMDADGVKSNA